MQFQNQHNVFIKVTERLCQIMAKRLSCPAFRGVWWRGGTALRISNHNVAKQSASRPAAATSPPVSTVAPCALEKRNTVFMAPSENRKIPWSFYITTELL
jgi:hypothetical protein